jgi:hypothetical protein
MAIADIETTRVIGRRFPFARWLDVVCGAWLFASVWMWPMPEGARINNAIVGICVTTVAGYAMFLPAIRWLNTLLAAWLIISSLTLFADVPWSVTTSNVIVGAVLMLLSPVRDVRGGDAQHDRAFVERWAHHRAR